MKNTFNNVTKLGLILLGHKLDSCFCIRMLVWLKGLELTSAKHCSDQTIRLWLLLNYVFWRCGHFILFCYILPYIQAYFCIVNCHWGTHSFVVQYLYNDSKVLFYSFTLQNRWSRVHLKENLSVSATLCRHHSKSQSLTHTDVYGNQL